jgi:DNA invertase Pin-like site-specific DNA recombinase
MKVDEVISDDGVSGGVSYAERNLGKKLLPKTKEGDMIIVSEISRLGRSMFDLNLLIHNELKPRKLRLVVVSMGIDLRCDKITAIDELILNNFSFAAQLEKQLIQERTLSALQVKKQQGIKLGGASAKWKEAYNNKTQDQLAQEYHARGASRTKRFIESRDTQAFMKILKNVFPEATQNDLSTWQWKKINTKNGVRQKVLSLMKDYRDIDRNLFINWDFTDLDSRKLQLKLASTIKNLQISVQKYTLNH